MASLEASKKCSNPKCTRTDYLPFECKFCKKYHCSHHKNDHGCTNPDRKALPCPTC